MAKLRHLAVSIDGYGDNGGAGPNEWVTATAFGQAMIGMDVADDAERGVDNDFLEAGVAGIGATIMGATVRARRGRWEDSEEWNGWWGPEPPYHHPVFVLTHHARPPLEMGETMFHFVTDGIESAYAQAMEAGGDVRRRGRHRERLPPGRPGGRAAHGGSPGAARCGRAVCSTTWAPPSTATPWPRW